MIQTDPNPRYPLLRIVTLSVFALAVTVAATDAAGAGSMLAWAVAMITLIIFGATFYVKAS